MYKVTIKTNNSLHEFYVENREDVQCRSEMKTIRVLTGKNETIFSVYTTTYIDIEEI